MTGTDEKKVPGRFTIGFNLADPAHRAVADLLNQQGRRKAQFLVNAVQHYIHCPETPDVEARPTGAAPLDCAALEAVVLHILEVKGCLLKPGSTQDETTRTEQASFTEAQGRIAADLLGTPDFTAIADTLAAFRQK